MKRVMKPPEYWRDEICNKFVINTRDPKAIINFVRAIQNDVIESLKDNQNDRP